MTLHILNGDALLPNFKRCGFVSEVLIWRESLIEGPVKAKNNQEFWIQRCDYICVTYDVPKKEYLHQVIEKLYKIENPSVYSEINLWFDFDLFCQTNLFYILKELDKTELNNTKIYWVQPEHGSVDDFFSGFSNTNHRQLKDLFNSRIELSIADLRFATNVWNAYADKDKEALRTLMSVAPTKFRFFTEAFDAHLQRYVEENAANRIEKRLMEAILNGVTSEVDLLHRFRETESIYGLGDLQVLNYLKELQNKNWVFELSITDSGVAALKNADSQFV